MANDFSQPLCSSCLYFVAMLLICLLIVEAQDGKITCTIPPVKPFHDTVLTCNFPEDLNLTKNDFTVYHYSQDNSPESVLDCWWIQGSLGCYSKAGFTFNKEVSRTLNVTVHHVTKATGKYACQIAGYSSHFFETCEFTFQLGQNSTCNISKEQDHSQATLTCFFNEDIRNTQRNFTVYKHDIQDKPTGIVNCWWENEKVNCQVNEGYMYNKEVFSYLRIAIPQPEHEKTEIYSCWHGGSSINRVNPCSLKGEKTDQKPVTHLIVGISLPAVFILITAIVVLTKTRACAKTKGTHNDEESRPMNPIKKKPDQVTKTFEDFLLTKTKEMYPDLLGGSYFVPPVYLNKLRYKTQFVAGQVVHILDPPDPRDEKRDRAMQHVLHHLRHMADTQQQQMFVLTQFQYEDYLNNPGHDYGKHRLLVPASLKQKKKYKDTRCFDFLIIHRYFGVLVGVVKAVDEKESGNRDDIKSIKENRDQSSLMIAKKTNSCKTTQKTGSKESRDSKQKTSDSESHDNKQETLNTEGQNNGQRTEDQGNQDTERIMENDEIQDDATKTKDKDKGNDDTVKKTDDKQSREDRRSTEKKLMKEVSEAIQQVRKADRIIKHLLSDQKQCPTVRLTLVLPNVTSDTLLSALNSHPELTQKFLECIQQNSTSDPIQLCLCADHLPNLYTTRNVELVKNHQKTYWDQFMDSSVDKQAMSDELYQNTIARFCGPSTISYFETLCQHKAIKYQLPKTVDQAVSLTGDLFERFTLHPGMTDLLDEPQMFFVGPPGTGKTRMLSLVGRKWLSEGHDVYVLYTSPEGAAASIELQTLLQQTPTTQSRAIPAPTVISLLCNIDDDTNINNTITMLKDCVKEKPFFALVDEISPEIEKAEQVGVFLRKIDECLKNSHLWAASYRSSIAPPGWNAKYLTVPTSCPPSILQEAGRWQCDFLKEYSTPSYCLPTDGLPVKHIFHQGPKHSKRQPLDCGVCGEEVAEFLTKDLHVSDKVPGVVTVASNTTSNHRTWGQPSTLQYRDVLMLFETDITEDVPMVTSIKDNGIPVQIIRDTTEKIILGNTVLISTTGLLNGLKRKVVVYVEGSINRQEFSAEWKRIRGITSCTSQLVCVCQS